MTKKYWVYSYIIIKQINSERQKYSSIFSFHKFAIDEHTNVKVILETNFCRKRKTLGHQCCQDPQTNELNVRIRILGGSKSIGSGSTALPTTLSDDKGEVGEKNEIEIVLFLIKELY